MIEKKRESSFSEEDLSYVKESGYIHIFSELSEAFRAIGLSYIDRSFGVKKELKRSKLKKRRRGKMDLTDPENDESFQVRVRFLNNLGRDHYVQITECIRLNHSLDFQQDHDLHPRDVLEKNMAREREIFLRASLQLLDKLDAGTSNLCSQQTKNKEHVPSSSSSSGSHGQQHHHSKHHANSSSHASSSTHQHQSAENTMYDVIRLGFLKKAKASNFPGHSNHHHSSSHHIHWKKKYVELRHGLFTYDDIQVGGNATLLELTNSDQSNLTTRRSISLSYDQTICQVYKNPNPQYQDDSILEISNVNGTKRLWMAASAEECQEWIRAIHAAMLGNPSTSKSLNSANSVNVLASVIRSDLDTSISYQSHGNNSDNNSGNSQENGGTSTNTHDPQALPKLKKHHSRELFEVQGSSKASHWLSIDGAAAPYAHDMSHFLNMQHEIMNIEPMQEDRYRQLLFGLFSDHIKITIPVLFIKVSPLLVFYSVS